MSSASDSLGRMALFVTWKSTRSSTMTRGFNPGTAPVLFPKGLLKDDKVIPEFSRKVPKTDQKLFCSPYDYSFLPLHYAGAGPLVELEPRTMGTLLPAGCDELQQATFAEELQHLAILENLVRGFLGLTDTRIEDLLENVSLRCGAPVQETITTFSTQIGC